MRKGLASLVGGIALAGAVFLGGYNQAYAQGPLSTALRTVTELPNHPLSEREKAANRSLANMLDSQAAGWESQEAKKGRDDANAKLAEINRKLDEAKKNLAALNQNKNTSSSVQPQTFHPDVKIFTCGSFVDSDKDGYIWDDVEFIGKTKMGEYELGQRFNLVSLITQNSGKNYKLVIFGPNGNKIYDEPYRELPQNAHWGVGIERAPEKDGKENWIQEIVREGGEGEYTAATYIDDQCRDTCKFRIKPRAQEVKSTSQPSLEQELQNKIIFTANRWIDLNTNGTIDYNEFQGVKNSFEEGEEMRICVQNNSPNSRNFMEVIYGPNGKVIRDRNDVFKPFKVCGAPPENWDNIFKPMLERGGIGSYKVAVYFDDKLAAVHDFEIRRKSNN